MAAQAAIGPRSFINSIGVNTHIDFATYGYEISTVAASINYLGLKNLRDSAQTRSHLATGREGHRRQIRRLHPWTLPPAWPRPRYISRLAKLGILNFLEGGNEEDGAYATSLGNTSTSPRSSSSRSTPPATRSDCRSST